MSSSSSHLRQLGKNGPKIPSIGFGLMGIAYEVYGSVGSDEERFAVLDRAHELGETFWDSADLYGDSEELIGKWFKRTGKRNDIFLATKFGFVPNATGIGSNSSASYCKEACAKSLKTLGIDQIDLYYLHMPNTKTPIEETMRALAELQAEGKIKYIGLSNISSNTLRRACKIAPVAAVQVEYSPFSLEAEDPAHSNLLGACRELGVAMVANSPLGRGLLTSSFLDTAAASSSNDRRAAVFPRFQEANRAANVRIVSQFKAMAEKKGCAMPQLALAWVLKQGDNLFAIPGTRRIKYLEENWGALKVQLSDADEAEIRAFVTKDAVVGSTLPDVYEDLMFADTVEES